MIVALVFFAGLAAFVAWWLSRQGLAGKPWLADGADGQPVADLPPSLPTAKVGLAVFMVVATSLLVLMLSAYSMRRGMADWNPPPQPALLWANTAVLVLASVMLHRASLAARRGDIAGVKAGLAGGGAATLAFLLGQLLAWRELAGAGYLPASNSADAFFYLLTAAHGLHVVGGLVALGRTGAKLRRRVSRDSLQLSVELSAAYAHFLLLAWVVLFGALSFSPQLDWLVAVCTAPFR